MNTDDPKKIEETVGKLRKVSHQFDALNFSLDVFLSEIDEEIRKNSIVALRLQANRSV
ncbi:hypothetical protein [Gloeomargarita lithophora]|uniref:hypothetical protein n=1 Tax=Gloeomargarita lithophora TaxID=1188228 RepID=UPI001561526F|nr:hypothetical protein [Gloeomargarita lithophora]